MGRAAESAAQFSRAIELASGNAAYHFNLANVEFMLRHDLQAAWKVTLTEVLRRALVEFRTASDLSPYDVEYARAYAETFYGMPDPDWAQAALAWKRVLALSPGEILPISNSPVLALNAATRMRPAAASPS
jgi:hypothetical protein